jgi:hypothetical protein
MFKSFWHAYDWNGAGRITWLADICYWWTAAFWCEDGKPQFLATIF